MHLRTKQRAESSAAYFCALCAELPHGSNSIRFVILGPVVMRDFLLDCSVFFNIRKVIIVQFTIIVSVEINHLKVRPFFTRHSSKRRQLIWSYFI